MCDSLRHRAKSWKYILYVLGISCFQNFRKFFEFDVEKQKHPISNATKYLREDKLRSNLRYIRFEETEELLMLAVLPIALLIFFNGSIWLQIRYESFNLVIGIITFWKRSMHIHYIISIRYF